MNTGRFLQVALNADMKAVHSFETSGSSHLLQTGILRYIAEKISELAG
jgi:hypothetical protein